MYDPSIGRWLEEDPTGFDAGDADLYRYVGNDPTNEVDPSGEAGEVINGKDAKPHVRFVVGEGLFGRRSAPASAGAYTDFELWDHENQPYGYYSEIRVHGDPDMINCCNTPFQLNSTNFDSHGGALALHLQGLSTGQYDVTVKIRVIAGVHKHNNPVAPGFTVVKGDKNREQQGKEVWQPEFKLKRIKAGGDHYVDSAERELTLRLNYESGLLSSSSDSIVLRPVLSFTGNKDEYMSVTMSVRVLEIKKVK